MLDQVLQRTAAKPAAAELSRYALYTPWCRSGSHSGSSSIKRFGGRWTILMELTVSCVSFALYGLSSQAWMMLTPIISGSLGGVAFPAIQSFIAG